MGKIFTFVYSYFFHVQILLLAAFPLLDNSVFLQSARLSFLKSSWAPHLFVHFLMAAWGFHLWTLQEDPISTCNKTKTENRKEKKRIRKKIKLKLCNFTWNVLKKNILFSALECCRPKKFHNNNNSLKKKITHSRGLQPCSLGTPTKNSKWGRNCPLLCTNSWSGKWSFIPVAPTSTEKGRIKDNVCIKY